MKTFLGIAGVIAGVGALGFILFAPYAIAPGTPAPETPAQNATLTVAANQRADALGVGVMVREVLEDSRCPTDVACIWAGTVRLATILYTDMGDGSAPQDFTLGESITTETHEVELVEVRPAARAGESIAPEEYAFVFEVRERNFDYLD